MALERIFAHFKADTSPTSSFYDPQDPNSYRQYVQAMMTDAKDYEDSILAHDRANAQLYYYGYEPWVGTTNPQLTPYIGEDPTSTLGEILDKDNENMPNRSTFVSTDVRDAVMLVMPALIRLFCASEAPVYIVPRTELQSDMAEQATDYVNYVFWNDNPGFLNLYGCFKDALTVKTGFLKWWSEDFVEKKRKTFLNITADQVRLMLSEDSSAKILDIGNPVRPPAPPILPSPSPAAAPPAPMAPPPSGPQPQSPNAPPGSMTGALPSGPGGPPPGAMAGATLPPLPPQLTQPPPSIFSHVTLEFEVSKPLIKIAGVPPEEMRLDRYARTFRESRIVGHERIVPADQLIAMGYDREKVIENIQSSESTFTVEPQLRNPGRFMGTRVGDGVKYGEWYVKIDKDGDGVPELRYICTMGDNYEIVGDEYANRVKFALFSCDPISHTIVGDSLADYTEDIQRIKTNLVRAVLDSAAESINPKTVINELLVNPDDAVNDDLGAVIRTRGDPSATVMFTNTPFLGQPALPVLELLNDVLQRRTGLTDAAKGLDPKALQSSTQLGVEAVINGAQERIEMIARVLCETGFRDLFTGLFNEVCENPNQQRVLKIRGKFVPFDTSTFDASMSVEVNENIGKGTDLVRMLALNQIKQDQQMLVAQMGLNNPICGVQEMLNTQTDILALANIKNVARYFKTPNPQQLQAMQSQPKTPDPNAVMAQAQLEKIRVEAAKNVAQQGLERDRLNRDDALKWAQLHQKTRYDQGKLQVDASKAGADPRQIEQEMQLEHAKAQHKMDLDRQKSQNDIFIDQQKMAHEAQMSREKNQADIAATMMQAHSQHQLGQQKADSAHRIGMSKIASQHVLGALAAENQSADEGEA